MAGIKIFIGAILFVYIRQIPDHKFYEVSYSRLEGYLMIIFNIIIIYCIVILLYCVRFLIEECS